jgi:hypothetical protein
MWGHDDSMTVIEQKTNRYLSPLSTTRKNAGGIVDRDEIWSKAAKIMIADCVRFNTQGLLCAFVDKDALSNVWWPTKLRGDLRTVSMEKALALWLNSTLGLLGILPWRLETEGPWGGFKKTMLEHTTILDIRKLKPKAIKALADAFDQLKDKQLMPYAKINEDKIREEIDSAIESVLGLESLAKLREMLSKEPIISLNKLADLG